MERFVRVMLAFFLGAAVGCSDEGSVVKPPADHPPVISGPDSVSAATGENVHIDYTLADSDGDRISRVDAEGAWSAVTLGGTPQHASVDWVACKEGSYSVTVTATSGDPPITGSTTTTITVAGQADNYIDIFSGSFQPDTLFIPDGETVAWRNGDSVSHVIEMDNYAFVTRWMRPGCESRPFMPRAGILPTIHLYTCEQHPGEAGVVIVRP